MGLCSAPCWEALVSAERERSLSEGQGLMKAVSVWPSDRCLVTASCHIDTASQSHRFQGSCWNCSSGSGQPIGSYDPISESSTPQQRRFSMASMLSSWRLLGPTGGQWSGWLYPMPQPNRTSSKRTINWMALIESQQVLKPSWLFHAYRYKETPRRLLWFSQSSVQVAYDLPSRRPNSCADHCFRWPGSKLLQRLRPWVQLGIQHGHIELQAKSRPLAAGKNGEVAQVGPKAC